MNYPLQKALSLLFVFFLTTCSTTSEKIAKVSDEELIQELTSRSYRYYMATIDAKNKFKVPAIEMNGKGHTISLHRNPNGRTYTVVDTAQPTINGTHFDPAQPLESSLGKRDPSNPYYKEEPVKFDYVKK